MDIISLLPSGYSPAFFLIAAIGAFGYAFNTTMVARYARKIDPFLVATIRGLSFTITLLPLLFLAPSGSIFGITLHLGHLFLASFFGITGYIFSLYAQRFFPVGIVYAFNAMTQIWLLVWSFLIFQDEVSWKALIAVFVILAGVISLGIQKSHLPHLDQRSRTGLIFVFIFPFLLSLGYFFMAMLSRETHPFVAGYFWEVLNGVLAGIIFLTVKKFFKNLKSSKHKSKVDRKEVIGISTFSMTTLLGTGAVSVLMTIGSPGIAQSIVGPLSVVFATILAKIVYHERLKYGQWISIVVVLLGVVLMKLTVGT